MKSFSNIEKWGDNHHPVVFDLLRLILGIFLFLKGYMFLENSMYLKNMLQNEIFTKDISGVIPLIVYYVIIVHMFFGLLITLGIFTRISAAVQLPVIIGALCITGHLRSAINSDFWLTMFTGISVVIFIIIGSGPLSVDHLFTRQKQ